MKMKIYKHKKESLEVSYFGAFEFGEDLLPASELAICFDIDYQIIEDNYEELKSAVDSLQEYEYLMVDFIDE